MIDHLQSILTQDNRITSDPIYLVEGCERINVESGCGEFADYTHKETYDTLTCEQFEELEDKYNHILNTIDTGEQTLGILPEDPNGEPFNPEDYYRSEYILRPVFQTACFTEKAAQDYIDCNGHNIIGREYRKPRIYVHSGWRNKEWQQIREYLIDKAMVESNNVSV